MGKRYPAAEFGERVIRRGPDRKPGTIAQRQAAALAARLQFTDTEMRVISRAAHGVWEEVASDLLGEGRVKQDQVIEVVADAGRLEAALRRRDAALAARWQALDYATIQQVLKVVFPYAVYC